METHQDTETKSSKRIQFAHASIFLAFNDMLKNKDLPNEHLLIWVDFVRNPIYRKKDHQDYPPKQKSKHDFGVFRNNGKPKIFPKTST